MAAVATATATAAAEKGNMYGAPTDGMADEEDADVAEEEEE
jgi:hypothetical protein